MSAKHLSIPERSAYRRLEDVVGCKWSAAVLGALQRGVNRPGKLERYIPGISTKVLTERLRRLLDYGLITRDDQSAVALHVEYNLTPSGERLAGIIEQLHSLQTEHGEQRAEHVRRSEADTTSDTETDTRIAQEKPLKLTASKSHASSTRPALSVSAATTTAKKSAHIKNRP